MKSIFPDFLYLNRSKMEHIARFFYFTCGSLSFYFFIYRTLIFLFHFISFSSLLLCRHLRIGPNPTTAPPEDSNLNFRIRRLKVNFSEVLLRKINSQQRSCSSVG